MGAGSRELGAELSPSGPCCGLDGRRGVTPSKGSSDTSLWAGGPGFPSSSGSRHGNGQPWLGPARPRVSTAPPYRVAACSRSARSCSQSLSRTTRRCSGAPGPARICALWSSFSMELQQRASSCCRACQHTPTQARCRLDGSFTHTRIFPTLPFSHGCSDSTICPSTYPLIHPSIHPHPICPAMHPTSTHPMLVEFLPCPQRTHYLVREVRCWVTGAGGGRTQDILH